MNDYINVIGAGLAGCEAALQISKRGMQVKLYEMKPHKMSDAHRNKNFAELVCSNSLKAKSLENAAGLLKREMELLSSVVIKSAFLSEIPSGGALSVDRDRFSAYITEEIVKDPNIQVINDEYKDIRTDETTIIATGPLTSNELVYSISLLTKSENLYFFDAAAPVVETDTINMNKAFFATRYDKGDADYINCSMTKEEYDVFYNFLINAQTAELKDFENKKVFEGCMPVEVMAKRGYDTLRFGPMKPMGITDPKTNERPYAVVQLRRDNKEGTLYNMVGFQTNLKFSEQKKLLGFIPGLENSKISRYGVMHRNTYINSPKVLNKYYQMKEYENVFFAGQITGVEGYLESADSGIVAGLNALRHVEGKSLLDFTDVTITGALQSYISDITIKNFQPMNANFGILKKSDLKLKKEERKKYYSDRSLGFMDAFTKKINI